MDNRVNAQFEECQKVWNEFVTYHVLFCKKGTKADAVRARKAAMTLVHAMRDYKDVSLEEEKNKG